MNSEQTTQEESTVDGPCPECGSQPGHYLGCAAQVCAPLIKEVSELQYTANVQAARIHELRAQVQDIQQRNEQLEAALAPFAAFTSEPVLNLRPDNSRVWAFNDCAITLGNLRAAAEALTL